MTDTANAAPLVAIIGRPNVGKSALFNRLTRTRRALVEEVAGTTRDRIYGWFDWRGRHVRVVDTGGVEGPEADPFSALIREQVLEAIDEADAIVLVVDAAEGVTAADEAIVDLLRRSTKPVLLVGNKADRREARLNLVDLQALGLGDPILISAYHGQGVADVMDQVLDVVPEANAPEREERLRIAVVGRPNVGKSSLVNAILGEPRVIVSDVPGTTRDAIDTPFEFEGAPLLLVDTAGIRRRGKIERGVERHSVQRAEHAIDRADVVFLVIDQGEPSVAQDTHIAGYVTEQGKGLVIVVNKWDLAEDRGDRHGFARSLDHRYHFVPWAPVQFTSALTGEGIRDLLELAVHIDQVRRRRVQTSELNLVVHRAMAEHGPPSVHGKRLKVMYATQAETEPPTFVFFVNDPRLLHFSYRRFLENRLRAAFGFEGTAIRMVFRRRSEDRHEVSA
ncbi:MAG: ribosome biogenesis GTPase Der [Dehalococcoidia bacterium]|nr:ribosome biogenesis GTPase Der [Dehalococcoidia bacterium]HRC61957.1 ribosome biogenesis GTPase Der [Dehalococcoidia bacterium]